MTMNGLGSPQRSFFGASFFTAPPEEAGDPLARRKTWWGGERDSSPSRKSDKQPEKEKRRSDKESSREESVKEKKENSRGEPNDHEAKARKADAKEVKEGGRGVAEYYESGEVKRSIIQVVDEAETTGTEPLLMTQHMMSTVDNPLNAETMEKTRTGEDVTGPLKGAKSLLSISSDKSSADGYGSTRPKKRWSLMITKRSPPGPIRVSVPSRKLTTDVAGSRFETAKEPVVERCAGDYPPIYKDGFVSSILSQPIYLP